MDRIQFALIELGKTGFASAPALRGDATSFGPGSANLIVEDEGNSRPFRGLDDIGVGSRVMVQIKDTFGGLDDVAAQQAAGSLFSWIAELLAYIGYGQVSIEGVNITGAIASSLLRVLLKWNGSYTDPKSGPFVVGLNQPSAPLVGVCEETGGIIPTTNGTYSFKIAWLRNPIDRSRASATSVVLVLTAKAAYLVFPSAPTGTTHGIVFVTKRNFGGLGLHYRLARANPYTGTEYTIDDIQRRISDLSVTNANNVVTSAGTALFTGADVGKRFAPVSAGFSVPNPTTITRVVNPTQIELSNNVTVSSGANPRTADIISYAGSIDRSVLLNWTEADLVEETAWFEDYQPPPGSHAFPLGLVWGIVTYADANSAASSTNPGTVVQFSLPNNIGGYNPLHNLYLPERVIDVLGRQSDSYVFVAGKTFVGAIQYIGITDGTPAILSVVLPDRGIATPKNWCISQKALYIMTAKGSLCRITEGGVLDESFASPIRHYIKNWEQEDTVLCSYPNAQSFAVSNGDETLLFNEREQKWSTPLYSSDFATGYIISGIGTRGKMYVTLENGSTRTAYQYDVGTGSFVSGISHYTNEPAPRNAKTVQEIGAAFLADRTDRKAYISLHKNARKVRVRGNIGIGSDELIIDEPIFEEDMFGWYVLIMGAGAAGVPLLARIMEVKTPTSISIGTVVDDMTDIVSLSASTGVTNAHVLLAYRILDKTVTRTGVQEVMRREMQLPGFYSFAVGITLITNGTDAVPLEVDISGIVNRETQWSAT